MANLTDALHADLSGYTPVAAVPNAGMPTPNMDLQPARSSMMRCPLPPIWQSNTDSLRAYYLKGQVPQTRLLSPVTLPQLSGSTTTTSTVVTSSSSGSGSSTVPALPQQATVKTSVLGPNQRFVGAINMTESFQLLSMAVGSACRIQLYGTATAQSADLARGIDVPPPAGTNQNLITDVVLDTAPFQWTFQNRLGANGDTPQMAIVYITITNLATTSDTIILAVQYVPLES